MASKIWRCKNGKENHLGFDSRQSRNLVQQESPTSTLSRQKKKVKPCIVCDTKKIPKKAGSGYKLLVYDPPHMNTGPNSNMSRVYGHHTTKQILKDIEGTAKEAHRVSGSGALMAFKWNTHDISLRRVFNLMKNIGSRCLVISPKTDLGHRLIGLC